MTYMGTAPQEWGRYKRQRPSCAETRRYKNEIATLPSVTRKDVFVGTGVRTLHKNIQVPLGRIELNASVGLVRLYVER